uniref:CSON003021 protein n=1 Tax=Culicoides sonorensis TaxID=179676 RepID=A0A336MYF5_CULSO
MIEVSLLIILGNFTNYLLKMYYKTIYTVKVVDLQEKNSIYECTSQYFLERAFSDVEVNVMYNRNPQPTLSVDHIVPLINSSLDQEYPAKIRINDAYGFGMLYIVENIVTLINYLENTTLDRNDTAFHLASANHVVLVTSRCSEFVFYDVISKGHNENVNGLIKWIHLDEFDVKSIESLFTYITRNFRGYPIRFTLFNRYATMISETNLTNLHLPGGFSGIDGIVLSYIVQKFNLNPIFYVDKQANYGSFNKKLGKFDGTLGDIVYNQSDVAINGRFIKDYGEGTEDVVEFLSSVFFDRICIVTPKAQEIPKWKAPLLIFSVHAWLGLFAIQLGSSFFWFILKKWESSRNTLFTASLTSSMSTTAFERDINTMEQLDRSHLQIWTGSRSLADLFGDSDTPVIESLKKKIKIRETLHSNIWITAHHRNVCSIERETDAEFIIGTKFMRDDGYPLLHVMQNCPRSYYIGYMVRKGWPFAGDFSRLITKFKEAGLTHKWYYDIQNAIVSQINVKNRFEKEGPEQFTLRHLIFSFYLLFIGLSFSVIVLCFEILFFKKKRKFK